MNNPTRKFCNKCNKGHPLSHTYCPDCGERLSDNPAGIEFPMVIKDFNEFTDFFAKLLVVYERMRPEFIKQIAKQEFELPKTKTR